MFVDRTNIARFFVCIWTEKQILFWVFHGGGNAKSHQTRVLSQSSSQYCKCHSSQFVWHLWRIFLSKECVHTSSWIHKSVKSYVLEDESICAARLSSTNCVSKFCHLEEFLSSYQWTSFSDAFFKDCCCCRCCFRGGWDFPALWRQRFPDAC